MKSTIVLAAAVLLAAPTVGLAVMGLEVVTKEKAKELGFEFRTIPAGPDYVRVELSFEKKGGLKDYNHASLEVRDGNSSLLSTVMKEGSKAADGRVVVSFVSARKNLDNLWVRVVSGYPGMGVGRDVRVKEFVDLDKVK